MSEANVTETIQEPTNLGGDFVDLPLPHWHWDVFGGREIVVQGLFKQPPLLKRLVMRFFLGSKWRRVQ